MSSLIALLFVFQVYAVPVGPYTFSGRIKRYNKQDIVLENAEGEFAIPRVFYKQKTPQTGQTVSVQIPTGQMSTVRSLRKPSASAGDKK